LDGIIVYVDEAGEPPAFYTAGWKDRENQIPADPQSLFKIASINKLYVAVATTKLVNDQRLSLDDTLADHFPELVGRIEYAETITLRINVAASERYSQFHRQSWLLGKPTGKQ
jgi:D-alanyl-D-alanine carboxypeptidase